MNASAVRVKWRAPEPELLHGQIRGYQIHYVRMNYGEPQGQPFVKDILIEDSQVILFFLFCLFTKAIKKLCICLNENDISDVFIIISDLCTTVFDLKQLISGFH